MERGVPKEMIVVGKPATPSDIYRTNTGYVRPSFMGKLLTRAYRDFNWCTGVMFWQYQSDQNGSAVLLATYQLEQLF